MEHDKRKRNIGEKNAIKICKVLFCTEEKQTNYILFQRNASAQYVERAKIEIPHVVSSACYGRI